MIEKKFHVGISELDEWKERHGPNPLGPGLIQMESMRRKYSVAAGLRINGFHESVAELLNKMLEATAKRMLRAGQLRKAETKDDATEAVGQFFFDELYLRLEAAQIPKHTCERIHLSVAQRNLNGDHELQVTATMLGAPEWSCTDRLEQFPSELMRNQILMLA